MLVSNIPIAPIPMALDNEIRSDRRFADASDVVVHVCRLPRNNHVWTVHDTTWIAASFIRLYLFYRSVSTFEIVKSWSIVRYSREKLQFRLILLVFAN